MVHLFPLKAIKHVSKKNMLLSPKARIVKDEIKIMIYM